MDIFTMDVIIENVYRDNPTIPQNAKYITEQVEFDWRLETTNGVITFKSVGYNQYLRKMPMFNSQTLDKSERGNISFERMILEV